ncbi:MAG: response regulator [Alphaproteobacteria bacterium]|nr:response regulator [Alphaproteobacteria bacterium]
MTSLESAAVVDAPSKVVYSYIGQRIKERRKLLRLNQKQLAVLMGFSYQQIQKYESGINQLSVSKLLHFARFLNVPPAYFYEGIKLDERVGKFIETDIIQRKRTMSLKLLFVEDNPNDVVLFTKALSSCPEQVETHIIHDPETVMDFLQNHETKYGKPKPDVIILDLSLPKISGMQLLKFIKKNPQTIEIPVIILTNSISKKEMMEAYRLGAAGFIQKSVDLDEYRESMRTTVKYWTNVVALPSM